MYQKTVSALRPDSVGHLVDSLRSASAAAQGKASALAWGGLAVAFVALFVGPFVQLRIAKSQIRATVLSANRQKWIDSLRSQVAAFLALVVETNIRTAGLRGSAGYHEAVKDSLSKLRAIEFNIILALNPKESDHEQLATALRDQIQWFIPIDLPGKDVKDFLDQIRDLSRSIFKREWERVKSLT
ncbi:MAG TPA: hypothetical protein VN706_11940 [Gemmatimonadaceae bacterium]|nr:hypothetical protein [Gemmatimonadaceae bacterium]